MAANLDAARAQVAEQIKVDIFTATQDEVRHFFPYRQFSLGLTVATGQQEGSQGGLKELDLLVLLPRIRFGLVRIYVCLNQADTITGQWLSRSHLVPCLLW